MTATMEQLASYEKTSHEIASAVIEQSLKYGPELGRMGVVRTYSELLEDSPLSEAGYVLYQKDETLGPIKTFKQRGATAALLAARDKLQATEALLGSESGQSPVGLGYATAASRGNHALGVGYASRQVGFLGAIVETAVGLSGGKRTALEAMNVILPPGRNTFEDARDMAKATGKLAGNAYIDPFDSVDTMGGAASVAHEMLDDLLAEQAEGNIDLLNDELTLLFPAGGGGLGAACAAVFQEARTQGLIERNVRVVLVQMDQCDAVARQRNGGRLTADEIDTSCDGTSVLEPGKLTMEIIQDRDFVDDVITAPKSYVGRAMTFLGYPTEPAGALSMAGAMYLANMQGSAPQDGRRHVMHTVKTGANITSADFADFTQEAMTMAERRESIKHLPNTLFSFEDEVGGNETEAEPGESVGILASRSSVVFKGPAAHFRVL